MRRRKFITLIGGAAAWPLAAHALQAAQPRLVGVLMGFAESDTSRALVSEFRGALANAGWKVGAGAAAMRTASATPPESLSH